MMARPTSATGRGMDDSPAAADAVLQIMQQQHQQQQQNEEDVTHTSKTKKKTTRPRLKPISCNDLDEDAANIDNPSLSVTCAHDLGFGSFVVAVPSTSSSSTTTAATSTVEKEDNKDDTNHDSAITTTANVGATASSYKPSPNVEMANDNSTNLAITSTTHTTTTTPIAKIKPVQPQHQQLPTPKLQPKSTIIFSSPNERSGGDGGTTNSSIFPPSSPHTPDYDDDGYGAFGFGLISASKEDRKKPASNVVNDTSRSPSEVEDNEEGGDTSDATSLENTSPRIGTPRGGNSGLGRNHGRKHTDRISSISLSRVLSADSYISDDSTTSSDHHHHHHHHHHQRQQQQQHLDHGPSSATNDTYINNRHDLMRHGSSLSSCNTNNNFSVLSRKNSIHTQTSSRSLTLHLMSSDRGDDDGTCNGDSINSVDFSLAAPSDAESSYFGQSSALQQQQQQGLQTNPTKSIAAYPHQSYYTNDAINTQYNSQRGIEPSSAAKSTRQLMAHTHPSPAPDDDVVELILSLSEESTTTGRKYNNANDSSIDAQKQPPPSSTRLVESTSLTPSSIEDDQVISNELRSYFRRISSASFSPSPPPQIFSSSYSASGRQPPIRNRRVDSIIAHYRNNSINSGNDDRQQQLGDTLVVSTNSAPHHRDSPFLTNLQMINSQASYGSVIHNVLQGEVGTSEDDIEEQQQGKLLSSAPTTSLAYSDEDGNADERCLIMSYPAGKTKNTEMEEERTKSPKFYSSRWTMLMYLAVLNMLSGWTCFSIAPFSELAVVSLGIAPDNLVAAFFFANFVASALEPMVLRRMGLRQTVLLGALLLMIGNILNGASSGTSEIGFDCRRAYLGFILAGLSGPLYQNTASVLITIWFPPTERRIATDVILCSNQLGIICSFVFGRWLIQTSDAVLPYLHSLGVMSMFVFVGTAMQFCDCPPTPPLGMVRVIRGTVERNITAVVQIAPPPPFEGPNEFVDATIIGERDTLLPAPSQSIPNETILTYGSTDPPVMMRSPDIPTPLYPGLEVYPGIGLKFQPKDYLPPVSNDGAEPIMTQTGLLNIEVCDDQLWRALRACFSNEGFLPCVSAHATSKIVINLLLTFMCYFTPDVGIIGCIFQLTVLASSLWFRKAAGESRLYYMIIGLVALSSLSLAFCGANLDSEVGISLSLWLVALFTGPIQPLSTNLGVEVVSPMSENTVVVTQLLFSNLLTSLCIPVFKALRNASVDGSEFAFSFQFLVFLCPALHLAAIYIASIREKYSPEENNGITWKESEQPIRLPNQEVGRATYSARRQSSRDLPWDKKYPFLIPRTV